MSMRREGSYAPYLKSTGADISYQKHIQEIMFTHKPVVKTILSSGHSLDKQAQDIMNKGCNGFIRKPFNIAALSQKIREVLSSWLYFQIIFITHWNNASSIACCIYDKKGGK